MSEYGVHHRKSYSPRLNPVKWFTTTMILSAAFCGTIMGAGALISPGAAHAVPAAALRLASMSVARSSPSPSAELPERLKALMASRQAKIISYAVRRGDSLSSIATRLYGGARWWTVLYDANRSKIPSPGLIMPGQVLAVPPRPATVPAAPAAVVPLSPPQSVTSAPAAPPAAPGGSYGAPPGSFEACVIQAESGGDPTAYNPSSGASGLFGDLLSTWDGLGLGYPGGAYTAPASVQIEGFNKLYAEAGMSPWNADGCPQKFSGAMSVHASLLSSSAREIAPRARHVIPLRLRVYEYAVHHQKGCPYVWGGNGPCWSGYDCSGLVVAAYKRYGIVLPRTTEEMAASPLLHRISIPMVRKGDLAMWFSGGVAVHVELVSYADRWVFGETDQGAVSGFTRDWGSPAFYAVRR